MPARNFSTIVAAAKAINFVLTETELGATPAHYFEPTNLGGLPPTASELRVKEDTELGNRTRFATHMCLMSASQALKACLDLLSSEIDLPPDERTRKLVEIASKARAAEEMAAQAAGVLLGEVTLPENGPIVVSRATS